MFTFFDTKSPRLKLFRYLILISALMLIVQFSGLRVHAAENSGATNSQLFLELNSPGNNLLTNSSSTLVSGKATQGSRVSVNEKVILLDDKGGFRQDFPLKSGSNELTVTVTNQAGQTLKVNRTVICDQNKPQLVITSPEEGETVDTPYAVIKGFTEKDCFVKINEQNVYPDAKGMFTHVVDYSPYLGLITATSTDLAGNITEVKHNIEFAGNQVKTLSLPPQIKVGVRNAINYSLGTDGFVSAEIDDNQGNLVKVLAKGIYRPAGQNSLAWNGTDSEGNLVTDGQYRFVITLRDLDSKDVGGRQAQQMAVRVPGFTFPLGELKPFNPLRGQIALIQGELSFPATITLAVYKDTKSGFNVISKNYPLGKVGLTWDGRDKAGKLLPDGQYKWALEVASLTDRKFSGKYRGTFWVDKGAPQITGMNLQGKATLNRYNLQMQYTLSEAAKINLQVFDRNWKSVIKLLNGTPKKAGLNRVSWYDTNAQGGKVAPGKYFIVISGTDNVGYVSKAIVKEFVIPVIKNVQRTRSRPMAMGVQTYTEVRPEAVLEDINVGPNPFRLGQTTLVCRYVASKPCTVRMFIYGERDNLLRLVTTRHSRSGANFSRWDGKTDGGNLVPDGTYRVTLIAEDNSGNLSSPYQVSAFKAARMPQITGVTVLPTTFNPKTEKLAIDYQLSTTANLKVSFGSGSSEQILFSGTKQAGSHRLEWDGEDTKGKLVADGPYTFIISAQNVTVPVFKSTYRNTFTIEKEDPVITGYSQNANPFRSYLDRPLLIKYSISEPARVTVTVLENKRVIRYLADQIPRKAGPVSTYWDGLDSNGKRVPDGDYQIFLRVVDYAGKAVETTGSVEVIAGLFVTSSVPDSTGKGFPVDGTLKLLFNDKIKRQPNYPGILLQIDGKRVPAKVEMTGERELSISPYGSLDYDATYTLIARRDGVKDTSGRKGNVEFSTTFRTLAGEQGDIVLPEVDLSSIVHSQVYQEGSGKKVVVVINEAEMVKILDQTVEVKRFIVPINEDFDETSLMLTESLRSALTQGKHYLELRTPLAAVSFPLEDASEDLLRRAPSNSTLKVTIIKLRAEARKPFDSMAKNKNIKVIGSPVSFRLEAIEKETSLPLPQSSSYLTGTLYLGEKAIPSYVGLVGINPEGSLVPLPAFQTLKQGKSAWVARLRRCNSVVLIKNLKTFTDINKHWAKEPITEISSKLFLEGQDQKRFNPNGKLTRAELAVCIARVLSLQPDIISIHFSDIKGDAWYAGQVGAMARAGILKGFPDGTFRPGAIVSRQELAVVLAGTMKYLETKAIRLNEDQTAVLDKFKDRNKVAYWGAHALSTMVVNKIMVGNDQGLLAPDKPVTRAELAALLQRVMQRNRY